MKSKKGSAIPVLRTILPLAALAVMQTHAASPQLQDYAQGIAIETPLGFPLIEVQVPDIVYRTVTSTDLRDLSVFNRDGESVPHAVCESPSETIPVISRHALPVFELQVGTAPNGNEARIDLSTASGTSVRIEASPGTRPEMHAQTRAHVMDARSIEEALRSIQFEWRSPDEASEVRIRIEASEDLDRWEVVVPVSTLVQVVQEQQQLRRETIPLPQRRYEYLRVVRIDEGPPLLITSVIAERVTRAQPVDPMWFTADLQGSKDAVEWHFDASRLAPVRFARLRLPSENMSVRVRIQSRGDAKAQWIQRWSGESYSIVAEGETRFSPPAEFAATHDRYWRVVLDNGSISMRTAPALDLGFRPARLQFLAQGAAPFTLAFGSGRVAGTSEQYCGSLIADVRGEDQRRLIAEGSLSQPSTLGGSEALQSAPEATPIKRIVLWLVLVAGVGVLIAMALSLLRRVRLSGNEPGDR